MRVAPRLSPLFVLALVSVACGEDTNRDEFKPPRDLGVVTDAGAGPADAASGTDAGPVDSGSPSDAGSSDDAGPPGDAGVGPDASRDAGSSDGGGASDAGPMADAGPIGDGGGAGDAGPGDASATDGGGAGDAGVADAGPTDGGAGDAGVGPAPASYDGTRIASLLATASCRNLSRCVPAYYDFNQTTESTCITEQTQAITSYYQALGSAVTAGTASYDATRLQACLDALATTSTCTLGLLDGDCDFITGNVTRGGGCTLTEECGASDWCSVSALNTCGTCAARAAAGQSCATTLCAADSECLDVRGAPTCIAVDNGLNATCGTVATGLCRGQLQCVVNSAQTAATCRAPASGNQACSTDNSVDPVCNINQGETCVGGSCRTVSWSMPGSSCTPPALCDAFGTCNGATNACDSRPGLGQSCAVETCAPDYFCDPSTSRCASPKTAGTACVSGAECADGLVCGGTPGSTTCQAWSWQACGGGGGGDAGVADGGAGSADAGVSDGG